MWNWLKKPQLPPSTGPLPWLRERERERQRQQHGGQTAPSTPSPLTASDTEAARGGWVSLLRLTDKSGLIG